MIAVDVSRWSIQGSVISRDVWRTLKRDHDVELAIVGAWHGISPNPGARASLENALHEGLLIHTYAVLNGQPAWTALSNTREILGGTLWPKVGRVWLDCELDGITVEIIRDGFTFLDTWGKPSGIYTARWWWADHFGNPTRFRDRPLWNALYDGDPDVDFPRYPYGGWDLRNVHGEQYTGTSYVAGVYVDWNYFYDHHVRGGTPVESAEIERRLAKSEAGLKRASQLRTAAGVWAELEGLALRGEKPSEELQTAARYLLGVTQ